MQGSDPNHPQQPHPMARAGPDRRFQTYQLNFNVLQPSDYNGSSTVYAANYTVWRNTIGSTADFRADGAGPGGHPCRRTAGWISLNWRDSEA